MDVIGQKSIKDNKTSNKLHAKKNKNKNTDGEINKKLEFFYYFSYLPLKTTIKEYIRHKCEKERYKKKNQKKYSTGKQATNKQKACRYNSLKAEENENWIHFVNIKNGNAHDKVISFSSKFSFVVSLMLIYLALNCFFVSATSSFLTSSKAPSTQQIHYFVLKQSGNKNDVQKRDRMKYPTTQHQFLHILTQPPQPLQQPPLLQKPPQLLQQPPLQYNQPRKNKQLPQQNVPQQKHQNPPQQQKRSDYHTTPLLYNTPLQHPRYDFKDIYTDSKRNYDNMQSHNNIDDKNSLINNDGDRDKSDIKKNSFETNSDSELNKFSYLNCYNNKNVNNNNNNKNNNIKNETKNIDNKELIQLATIKFPVVFQGKLLKIETKTLTDDDVEDVLRYFQQQQPQQQKQQKSSQNKHQHRKRDSQKQNPQQQQFQQPQQQQPPKPHLQLKDLQITLTHTSYRVERIFKGAPTLRITPSQLRECHQNIYQYINKNNNKNNDNNDNNNNNNNDSNSYNNDDENTDDKISNVKKVLKRSNTMDFKKVYQQADDVIYENVILSTENNQQTTKNFNNKKNNKSNKNNIYLSNNDVINTNSSGNIQGNKKNALNETDRTKKRDRKEIDVTRLSKGIVDVMSVQISLKNGARQFVQPKPLSSSSLSSSASSTSSSSLDSFSSSSSSSFHQLPVQLLSFFNVCPFNSEHINFKIGSHYYVFVDESFNNIINNKNNKNITKNKKNSTSHIAIPTTTPPPKIHNENYEENYTKDYKYLKGYAYNYNDDNRTPYYYYKNERANTYNDDEEDGQEGEDYYYGDEGVSTSRDVISVNDVKAKNEKNNKDFNGRDGYYNDKANNYKKNDGINNNDSRNNKNNIKNNVRNAALNNKTNKNKRQTENADDFLDGILGKYLPKKPERKSCDAKTHVVSKVFKSNLVSLPFVYHLAKHIKKLGCCGKW